MSDNVGENNVCCRVCLSSTLAKNQKMLPLTACLQHTQQKTLLECLRSITQLEVPICMENGNDTKYPTHICLRCSKALQVAVNFVALAQDSDVSLRAQLANLKFIPIAVQQQEYNKYTQVYAQVQDGTHQVVQLQHYAEEIGKGSSSAMHTQILPINAFSSHFNAFVQTASQLKTKKLENSGNEDLNNNIQHIIKQEEKEVTTAMENYTNTEIIEESTELDCDLYQEVEKKLCAEIATPCTNAEPGAKSITNLSEANIDFIDDIKENLYNDARQDFALLRNKKKTLADKKELENALAAKEAEVNNNQIKCVQCDKHFTDMHVFLRHRNRHKGITPFRCNSCNFFTCYYESLRKHYKKEHNIDATNELLYKPIDPYLAPLENPYYEITYKCINCNLLTHNNMEMQIHVRDEHLINSNLDAHILKVYNCPDCHRTFKDQRSMRTHFTLMHGSSLGIKKQSTETYICEHCDKQFQFKASLTTHQHVCRLREAVKCTICIQKFSSVRQYERHLRAVHAVETIHECEVCSKTFNNPESLTIHRKRHTERHYQCERCPRNYVNSSELRVHVERMHGTEVKALCRACGITFTHIALLRKHENKVHFKKYLNCLYCDYKSTSRCSVRLHQYIHTGKPYKCELCEKSFALRAYMRRHSINVHGVELTEEQLAAMFRKKFGYPSRYDAFSKANSSLEITEVSEEDIEMELQEFGLKFDDIVKDLFENGCSEELFNLS